MDMWETTDNPVGAVSGEEEAEAENDSADSANDQEHAATRPGFGEVPQGYVEPVDVAFLNKFRRAIGSYPPSLAGSSLRQRVAPFIGGLLTILGAIGYLSIIFPQSYNYFGRVGYHDERVPVLVVTEAVDEPPLRVQMGLPECDLCGSSADVAVQLTADSVANAEQGPGSTINAPKGRNDESGARYVWNGPYVEGDFQNDAGTYDSGVARSKALNNKGVGTGATYAYRWGDVRLQKNHNFLNASMLLEVFDVDNDAQKDFADL
jgi:hypothetical protein